MKIVHMRKHKGFTLAELLIVVAIVGILLGFGFVQVARQRRMLKVTEMDDTAREIFIAAQNQLTEKWVSGEWDDYLDELSVKEDKPGSSMSSLSIYEYVSNRDSGTNLRTFQDYLLPRYSIDDTVWNNSILIGFDSKSHTIYEVYYYDGNSGISEQEASSIMDSSSGALKVKDRETRSNNRDSEGNRKIIGYYGTGEIDDDLDLEDDWSPKMAVFNEENLYLKIYDCSKGDEKINLVFTGATSGATMNVSVPDSNNGRIVADPDSSKPEYYFLLDSVTAKLGNKTGHFSEYFSGFYPGENVIVSGTVSSNIAGNTRKLRAVRFNSLFNNIEIDTQTGSDPDDKTYHYRAKISNGRHLQNLNTQISGLVNQPAGETTTVLNVEGASLVQEPFKDPETLSVSYYDLGITWYLNDDPDGESEDFSGRKKGASFWQNLQHSPNVSATTSWKQNTVNWIKNRSIEQGQKYYFQSIDPGEYTEYASTFVVEGNTRKIEGLLLEDKSAQTDGHIGLFGQIEGNCELQVKDLLLIDPYAVASAGNCGSLVGNIEKNGMVNIEKCGIYASTEDYYLNGTQDFSQTSFTSPGYPDKAKYDSPIVGIFTSKTESAAGGLVGCSAGGLKIKNSFVSIPVTNYASEGSAGGLIGKLTEKDSSVSSTEIDGSYVSGCTDKSFYGVSPAAVQYDDEGYPYADYSLSQINISSTFPNSESVAGGLIGTVSVFKQTKSGVNIRKCFSAASVGCVSSFGYSAGLIGCDSAGVNTTIEDSYVFGRVFHQKVSSGAAKSAGFVVFKGDGSVGNTNYNLVSTFFEQDGRNNGNYSFPTQAVLNEKISGTPSPTPTQTPIPGSEPEMVQEFTAKELRKKKTDYYSGSGRPVPENIRYVYNDNIIKEGTGEYPKAPDLSTIPYYCMENCYAFVLEKDKPDPETIKRISRLVEINTGEKPSTEPDKTTTFTFYFGDWPNPKEPDYLDIEVDNGNRLVATVTAGKDIDSITLMVMGNVTGNPDLSSPILKKMTLKKTVDPSNPDAKSGKISLDGNTFNFGYWREISDSEPKMEYNIVLDDITVPGGHFADICNGLMPGENIGLLAKPGYYVLRDKTTVYNQLYTSGYTPALPTGKFKVTNSIYGYEQTNARNKTSATVDTNKKAELSAVIYSIRHLENLSPTVSGVGLLPSGTPSFYDEMEMTANQVDNIAWQIKKGIELTAYVNSNNALEANVSFVKPFLNEIVKKHADMRYYQSPPTDGELTGGDLVLLTDERECVYPYNATGTTPTPISSENSFYPVHNQALSSFDGTKDTNTYYGYLIENVQIRDAVTVYDTNQNPTDALSGLFAIIPEGMTVNNLGLRNLSVNVTPIPETPLSVGGLAGEAAGTVNHVLVYSDQEMYGTPEVQQGSGSMAWVSSTGIYADAVDEGADLVYPGNAGGLIGSMTGGTITDCAAAVAVKGLAANTGGLIGSVSGGTVSNSYSGGHTYSGNYANGAVGSYDWNDDPQYAQAAYNITSDANGSNVGGLIGSVSGTSGNGIQYCYSTCSAYGANAGGLIGNYSDGKVSNCYETGKVQAVANGNAGALVGNATGWSNDFTGNYYLEIVNEVSDSNGGVSYLSAVGYVGGTTSITAEQIKALDADLATYNTMVDASGLPIPYDNVLSTYFNNGGDPYYPYKTIGSLHPDSGGTDVHYGDWPAPETLVINTASQ